MGIRREIATCLDLLSGNKQREQKGKKEEQSAASKNRAKESRVRQLLRNGEESG
jgi:hypothetical protein